MNKYRIENPNNKGVLEYLSTLSLALARNPALRKYILFLFEELMSKLNDKMSNTDAENLN